MQCLCETFGSGTPWNGAGGLAPDKHSREIGFYDQYGMDRWEVCIPVHMGTFCAPPPPPVSVQ